MTDLTYYSLDCIIYSYGTVSFLFYVTRTSASLTSSSTQFLFNSLVKPPKFLRPREEPLLEVAHPAAEESLDETARLPADLGTSGYDVVPDEATPHGSAASRTEQA